MKPKENTEQYLLNYEVIFVLFYHYIYFCSKNRLMNMHIHREITPLKEKDCFLLFDRKKMVFGFPLHFHPEYEITYIFNAKGAKRIVGDHIGEIGERELVMVGPNLYHGWADYKNKPGQTMHEITIQFPRELFTENLLNKNARGQEMHRSPFLFLEPVVSVTPAGPAFFCAPA